MGSSIATDANGTATKANRTMKAIVQEGQGSADNLHLREVDIPELTDDRVLVRVRAASVNALDWHTVHGGFILKVVSTLMRSKDFPIRGVGPRRRRRGGRRECHGAASGGRGVRHRARRLRGVRDRA